MNPWMVAFSLISIILLFSLLILQIKMRRLREELHLKDEEIFNQNNLIADLNTNIEKKYNQVKTAQSKLDMAERKIMLLESIDSLTGLANRESLETEIETEWKRAHRSKQALTLIVSDIDYFKIYRDSYGKEPANNCLKKIAEIMKETAKRSGDLIARFDADRFALLLPDTDQEGAARVAEKIRRRIEQLGIPHLYSPADPFVTISLGYISVTPTTVYEAGIFTQRAEKALVRAKQSGRNVVVDYYKTWPEPHL